MNDSKTIEIDMDEKLDELAVNPPYNFLTKKEYHNTPGRFEIINFQPGVGYATKKQWNDAGYKVINRNGAVYVNKALVRPYFDVASDIKYFTHEDVILDCNN